MATLTHLSLTDCQLPRPRLKVWPHLSRVADTLRLWRRRLRERQELAKLSAYELRDIGASSSERFRELDKPFWRD